MDLRAWQCPPPNSGEPHLHFCSTSSKEKTWLKDSADVKSEDSKRVQLVFATCSASRVRGPWPHLDLAEDPRAHVHGALQTLTMNYGCDAVPHVGILVVHLFPEIGTPLISLTGDIFRFFCAQPLVEVLAVREIYNKHYGCTPWFSDS